jgi:hypothetical protein
MSFDGYTLLPFLGINLGIKLLGYGMTTCLALVNVAEFSKMAQSIYVSPATYKTASLAALVKTVW